MISIIVTHKQELNYLSDCLESVAEQKYKDIETILVLDHTEDDVNPLIEKYGEDINIKVFELEDKTGVSAARNFGMEQATGEYIMFLDNDDYMLGESLQSMVDAMDDDTDIVYGQLKNTYYKREAYISGKAMEYKGEEELLGRLDFNDPINYCVERYRTLEKLTILGCLYRKKYWDDNNIKFNESQPYYADVEVVARVFSLTDKIKGTEGALYIKRNHNDKVNNPALSQYPKDDTMPYYICAYKDGVALATNKRVQDAIKLILARYISKWLPRKYRGSADDKWRNEYYEELKNLAVDIDKRIIRKSDLYHSSKVFLYKFIKGDEKTNQKAMRRVLIKRKIKKMIVDKRVRNKTITLQLFTKLPQKENWIVFQSFMGRNYSGQPKYIYQYLQKHYGDKYKFIWIVDRKGIVIDGKHVTCKRWGLRFYYYLNRSKYWVFNMRQPISIPKRDTTVLLATWHGTPLKRLVFDMEENYSATPEYKSLVYRQTREWNYMLSDNPYSTEKFQKCFLVDREQILESGYPANDPMYAPDREERAAAIKKKLGIDPNKKVLLYAPTWRDDNWIGEGGQYSFDLELDINRLEKEFGDEYILLLRLHYFVVEHLDMSKYGDFTVDVSSYSDVTDLYLISDMLMTDYSSVFFDYANLKRPVIFFMYDLENYRDVLHGFYLDINKDLPGPILQTNDEVVDAIKNIDKIQEEYKERYEEFYDRFCCLDDGHASQRVVETVFGK